MSPVRWEACAQALAAHGATAFLEAGPGDVLTKMAKRVVPGADGARRRLARRRHRRRHALTMEAAEVVGASGRDDIHGPISSAP